MVRGLKEIVGGIVLFISQLQLGFDDLTRVAESKPTIKNQGKNQDKR